MKREDIEFKKILFQAVYEGMYSIGDSVPAAIIPYLERNGSVKPGGVITSVEAFDKDLTKIFGFGAKVIEKKILEILCTKLQISLKADNDFSIDFKSVVSDIEGEFHSKETGATLAETVDA